MEKSLIIGCDNASVMTAILGSVNEMYSCQCSTITVTKPTDLFGILRAFTPDLLIISFRSNQLTLDNLDTYVRKPEIPVLCLCSAFESASLQWSRQQLVFTYPLEHAENREYLSSRIASVLKIEKPGGGPVRNETQLLTSIPETEPPANNRNLSKHVMELDQKIEVLRKVKNQIQELYPKVDDPIRATLTSIVQSIRMSAGDSRLWEDFRLYFEETDPGFLLRLAEKHTNLTTKDLKYCCYLKMNMTNNDIQGLLGINQESVRTHKYRLKKKMRLSRDNDLRSYLKTFGHRET